MGLKSIDVLLTCSVHGTDIEVVDLAGNRYCRACLDELLGAARVTMTTRRNLDETETTTCRHCGGERHIDDRPCAICGGDP
jgi:RNase P subunit RPR2